MLRTPRHIHTQMEEARAWELLARAEHAVLSMISPDGDPYAVPLNFVLDGKTLWAHCAKEGQKLEAIAANPRVCVTATLSAQVIPEDRTTHFECVIALGDAAVVTDVALMRPPMEMLMDKFCEGWRVNQPHSIDKGIGRMSMLRVDVTQICGREKRD